MIYKFICIILLAFIFTSVIHATPQSDYDYQLTQYRKHHAEFQVLKEDNQKAPTLDNQQKALQAAKQTIISRDTTKIAYIELILDSIRSQKITQDYVLQAEKDLVSAREFYISQINLAKNIISIEDLTNFTLEYLEAQLPYQSQIIKAQATRKLAILNRLQINTQNAYDGLLPSISDNTLNPVVAGLNRINQLSKSINETLQTSIQMVNDSEVSNYSKQSFFNKQIEKLFNIKNFQIELVNILVDLEQNYAN
jgi:hypothetical protein